MSTLKGEQTDARSQLVKVTTDTLTVDLIDGRTISVPLAWFPRLLHSSVSERNNWCLIAHGEGIHWIDLDEDISVEGLLVGQQSRESQSSLERWLHTRGIRRSSRKKTPTKGLQPTPRTKKARARRD
jgi:hypothetical protein